MAHSGRARTRFLGPLLAGEPVNQAEDEAAHDRSLLSDYHGPRPLTPEIVHRPLVGPWLMTLE